MATHWSSDDHSSVGSLPEKLSALDTQMLALGLVNVLDIASHVIVDLKYSTTDNFTGEDLYGRMKRCYLQPEVAEMIAKAQAILESTHPELRLKLFDCARPMHVQQRMWELVRHTEAHKYVAAPSHGSLHNFGAAVDLTLSDTDGNELDMGSPFDNFDSIAQPRYEMDLYERGRLTQEQLQNRWLLRNTMKQAGFIGILLEWWHFNAMTIEEARGRYTLIE